MKRFYALLFVLLLFATGCGGDSRKGFSMTVTHYSGGIGLTRIYALNEKGLFVDTNCDFENCEQQTVYKRSFTKNESDNIYRFINSIKLDTLNSSYKTERVLDGLVTKLTFGNGLFSSHSATFDNFKTPVTDTLFKFIDNLIQIKKYRFYQWGRED